MAAILIGLCAGIMLGVFYLIGTAPAVRRTLTSSILLGVFLGVLVELARQPLLAAVFVGLGAVFIAEFIRWVSGGRGRRSSRGR